MMERSAENIVSTGKWGKIIIWTLGVILLLMFVIGFWASREPKIFWVNHSAEQETAVVGYSTVDTLIRVSETLLGKNAGYLTNDKLPPFVFLDNIPSWELGVVNQMRDLGRVMRDDYTRSQSQSKEDPDVAEGAPKFFYDNNSWIFPTTESEYREGIKAFIRYRDRRSMRVPTICVNGYRRSKNALAALPGVSVTVLRRRGSTTISRVMRLPRQQGRNRIRSTFERRGGRPTISFSRRAARPGRSYISSARPSSILRTSCRTRTPRPAFGRSFVNWKPASHRCAPR
jgi:hypothetical protein